MCIKRVGSVSTNRKYKLIKTVGDSSKIFGVPVEKNHTTHAFTYLRGVDFNDDEDIVVTDCEEGKIYWIDRRDKTTKVAEKKSEEKMEYCNVRLFLHGFQFPEDVISIPDGRIILGENGRGKIRIIDGLGNCLVKFGGRKKPGDFCLQNIHEISHSANGLVFVADMSNNKIASFDESGKFIQKISASSPFGLCVHPQTGDIVFVNKVEDKTTMNFHRETGELIKTFDFYKIRVKEGENQEIDIYGFAIDENGTFVVTDSKNGTKKCGEKNSQNLR